MRTIELLLLAVALIGHGAIWIMVFNRLHAVALPCPVIKALEKVIALIVLAGPAAAGWWWIQGHSLLATGGGPGEWLPLGYLAPCWAVALVATGRWVSRQPSHPLPQYYRSYRARLERLDQDVSEPLAVGPKARLLASVPGNEVFQLEIVEKTFQLPRLPKSLDGLVVAHLSDLHFTGKITRPLYDAIIRHTNALDADLMVITGDLLDKAACLDWIPETLGRLEAPHGVYFVLGNHDKRIKPVARLRQALVQSGLVDLGGRVHRLSIDGAEILLAGNELPWFKPAPQLPPYTDGGPFRLLASHTPDQIHWARQHRVDLMLAGHTHGGQIRLPWIGPIIAPSRHGVKYASGVFYEAPTLMHVTRGVSGVHPIRLNCPPELNRLVLRATP